MSYAYFICITYFTWRWRYAGHMPKNCFCITSLELKVVLVKSHKLDKKISPVFPSCLPPPPSFHSSGYPTPFFWFVTTNKTTRKNVCLPFLIFLFYFLSFCCSDKRGFDFGTGRSYSGFQAMRGNLGLAFASPGSHGKWRGKRQVTKASSSPFLHTKAF